jgi:hypothetical protein
MTTSAREESARLSDLLRREHGALAEFLVALSIFDHERRWKELGYGSLFDYLHRHLGLSKGAAFYRMTAARIVRDHPAVVEPLGEGRLCLTTVVELAKVLTDENQSEVLPRFFHLSKREAQAITAELRPAECVPLRTVVTAVRTEPSASPLALGVAAAAVAPELATGAEARAEADIGQAVHPANRTISEMEPVPARDVPALLEQPLTADLSRVHITVPRRFMRKLEAARNALSHSNPGATEDEILEVGLDLILERQARRRGLVKHPRKNAAASAPTPTPLRARSRYIPADVRREVWERDGGQCQHPLPSGGVCGSKHELQIHHLDPFARGGAATIENLGIRCRSHNDVEARRVFGDEWMDRFTGAQGGKGTSAREPLASYGSRCG